MKKRGDDDVLSSVERNDGYVAHDDGDRDSKGDEPPVYERLDNYDPAGH